MKHMKRLASFVLALIMVFALATTASAADDGSITITNAVAGETYDAYQMFELESFSGTAYSYKITEAWRDFVENGFGKDYFEVDAQGYVSIKTGVTVEDNSETAASIAKEALAYAKAKPITPTASLNAENDYQATGLSLGYYLIDSSLGTLCGLTTTDKDATVTEKNEEPTITKEVQEDSDSAWGETDDADINQTVNFRATITVKKGTENYVMHDVMSAGLTYIGVTSVTVGGADVNADNYTVIPNPTDDCTFEVVFENDYISTLAADTQIVVAYSATLNEDAVIAGEGNPNEAWLSYGENSKTTEDKTITYTWEMDVLKYGNGDKTKVLAGAEFVLLNEAKNQVAAISNGKFTGWIPKDKDTTDSDGKTIVGALDADGNYKTTYVLTTDANGKIEVDGLDADTYYLHEVKAPDGYNKLKDDISVTVVGQTLNTETDKLEYTPVVAEVNNQSGTELPSTGGIGTTIFYIVGGVLVLAAIVLLVTKKRMNREG